MMGEAYSDVYGQARGLETDLAVNQAGMNVQAAEANMAAAKKFSSAKNPQEMMDLQTEWAKTAFDGFVAEATKLQDISVKVSNQASQPINDRINKAVETFAKPIAA